MPLNVSRTLYRCLALAGGPAAGLLPRQSQAGTVSCTVCHWHCCACYVTRFMWTDLNVCKSNFEAAAASAIALHMSTTLCRVFLLDFLLECCHTCVQRLVHEYFVEPRIPTAQHNAATAQGYICVYMTAPCTAQALLLSHKL
jgi:hypothetical protein